MRSGLRKVTKVVRGVHGSVRRTYWMRNKPQDTGLRLYHGSPISGLTTLKPHPSDVLKGKKAVFATPSRPAAVSFLGRWSDSDLEHGEHNGRIYVRERYKGAFNQVYRGQKGTIYEVESKGFRRNRNLAGYERVRYSSVQVQHAENIKDAYRALKQTDAVLARYGRKLPWEA